MFLLVGFPECRSLRGRACSARPRRHRDDRPDLHPRPKMQQGRLGERADIHWFGLLEIAFGVVTQPAAIGGFGENLLLGAVCSF